MKQILVVDDSRIITHTLKNIIEEKLKYKCITASSKKECKKLLEEYNNEFEVALLDLGLPDAPNGEVIDLVEKTGIPIIVLTGSADKEEIFREKNIVDYVIKDGAYSIFYTLNIANQLIKNKTIKVLVADDSKVFLEKVSDLLLKYNLQVYKANDGKEALEIFNKNPDIKLLFTDYLMPNLDGIGLTRELRKKYKKNQLSIIVTSASADTPSKFLKYGANDFINKSFTKEEFYTRLNSNLEILSLFEDLEIEAEKNREKDKLLFSQHKMVAIGDLLHNISHHWRQPLSLISTISGSIIANRELHIIDEKREEAGLNNIVDITKSLSKTIEDFVTFFKKDDAENAFNLKEHISRYIELVKPSYSEIDINITLNSKAEPLLNGDQKAFNQIMLNLFNNSRESFKQNNLIAKEIFIEIDENKKNIIINFKDTAGGIDEKIIDRIFEPYFTTKHQEYGKGMGLYLTKETLSQTFKGDISVTNVEFELNGIIQTGALFTITIPKN